jgi:hypothetical protein
MKTGEVRELCIPADEGYGKAGRPPAIPADSTLVFTLTCEKIGESFVAQANSSQYNRLSCPGPIAADVHTNVDWNSLVQCHRQVMETSCQQRHRCDAAVHL